MGAEEAFRFPTATFYEELRKTAEHVLCDGGSDVSITIASAVVALVRVMFKQIALIFQPHGSYALLELQSLEIYRRVRRMEPKPPPVSQCESDRTTVSMTSNRFGKLLSHRSTTTTGSAKVAGLPLEDMP